LVGVVEAVMIDFVVGRRPEIDAISVVCYGVGRQDVIERRAEPDAISVVCYVVA
jgi:hypothetical protein